MQEPTIYRQPIANLGVDPEASALPSEENTFKSQTMSGTVQSMAYDTASEKDYHDFIIPEG
jgi:hypothetical protein